MRTLTSLLHGAWTGAAAGASGGALFAAAYIAIAEIARGNLLNLLPATLLFGLYGAVVGAPFGAVAGVLCALLLNTYVARRHLTRLGTIGGGTVGFVIAASLQGIRWSGNWTDIAVEIGLIVLGGLAGALGGYIGARLYDNHGYGNDSPTLNALD